MLLNIYLILTLLIFIPYSVIILLYRKWFLRLKQFVVPTAFKPQTTFTVIIPARNEEQNIGKCLHSILQQNYPLFLYEIIVVDDFSTDKTVDVVQSLKKEYSNLHLLKLADELDGKPLNAYKKKAIEKAIKYATGNWIVTTDADCMVTKNWLMNYAALIEQTQPAFIAAPVVFTNDGTLLSMFQYIDFVSLQGITAASVSAGFHAMCNGANLAYRKDVFYRVNGFKGIDNIASGDDMLLMNKIKQEFPNAIGFLFSKDAIVSTSPMPNWKAFINQRIRWASKSDKYKDKTVFWVLVLVYFLNLFLFIMPFIALVIPTLWLYWLIFLIAKTFIELSFAVPVGNFFGQSFIWWFPLLQPLHITYMVVAGWLGKFGNYKWKGRSVK